MNTDFNEIANYQYIHSKLDSLDLKILTYFYDENGISRSQRSALYYYKTDYSKSARTFYNRVDKLEKYELLLHTFGKSPKYFVVTNLALALGLINSNDSNIQIDHQPKNFKPIENSEEITNTIANSINPSANSLKKSEITIFKYFNDVFLSIIHNFLIKIPIEINTVNYENLRNIDSTFSLVSELINVRRYSKALNFEHPKGNFKAFVNIQRKSITVRLYEIHTLDLDNGFSKAIDRVLEVLDAVQKNIGVDKIQFAEISQWKLKDSTGKVVQLDVELANHPINHLLKERIKFSNKTSHWLLIDTLGNKVGFDCSPRNLGKGRRKEPHLEITGIDAQEKTDFLLQDMRYQMQKEIGVEKLHQVIRGVRNFTQTNRQKINVLEENQKELTKLTGELSQVQDLQNLALDLIEKNQDNTLGIVKENQSMITKLISKLFPQENIVKRFYNKLRGVFTTKGE